MFTLTLLHYTVATAVLIRMITVQSLPIECSNCDKNSLPSVGTHPDDALADTPVIISCELHMQLTNRMNNASGLFQLWLNASDLTKPTILKAKVR